MDHIDVIEDCLRCEKPPAILQSFSSSTGDHKESSVVGTEADGVGARGRACISKELDEADEGLECKKSRSVEAGGLATSTE